jgi:peptide/nickel transport system substrate-binding protein
VTFERVEGHYSGEDATFQEIDIRWIAEPSTKLAMMLAGEAHIADLPPELMPDAVGAGMEIVASLNPSMHVTGVLNGQYMTEGDEAFNPDVPWLDIRIREAMNRSIGRGWPAPPGRPGGTFFNLGGGRGLDPVRRIRTAESGR